MLSWLIVISEAIINSHQARKEVSNNDKKE